MKQRTISKLQRGFTLIELMITLAILGVVLAIAIPNYTDWMNRKRVEGAATEFSALINYGRSEAIKRNQRVYLKVTSGTNWNAMVLSKPYNSAAGVSKCVENDICDLRHMLPADYPKIKISAISAQLNGTIIDPIDPLFTFTSGNAEQSVTFQSSNYEIKAKITITGLISFCTSADPIPGYSAC